MKGNKNMEGHEEKFRLEIPRLGEVTAAVAMPGGGAKDGVVVAHGQANDLDHPLIATFCEGMAARGYGALRFNFPYKEEGKKNPDGKVALMRAYRAARDELMGRLSGDEPRVFLAGKSLGARVASYVADVDGAPGLIFLGYPLNAPGGEPGNYEHLLRIRAPMLFFAGARDPLCDPDKLEEILEQREYPSSLQKVEGGDHSFAPPSGDDRTTENIYEDIAMVTADWLEEYF